MNSIHDLLKIHKKVMFSPTKTAVDCILKPYPSHNGYNLTALTSFVGLTIDESGFGCYADSFELTLNIDDVCKYTDKIPSRDWVFSVKLPQLNNKIVPFVVEDVATDRTVGLYLIKCSSLTKQGDGKKIDRNYGGI